MPLIIESHESLPYIDREPSAEERASAKETVSKELPADHETTLHPSVKTSYEPQFPSLVAAAHDSIASTGKPRAEGQGIDLSRYEEPSQPDAQSDTRAWQDALKAAYTSHEYLQARALNLDLLEKHGKNAWLIGNSQLEYELRSLESDVAQSREQLLQLGEERRKRQESVQGEFEGLDQSWRNTLGRAIEAEVAGEGLKAQIEQRRRGG